MTQTVTSDQFRSDFREFTSGVTYPESMVNFWLQIAQKQVNSAVWKNQTNLSIELYAAHNIVLEVQAARTALTGGVPGVSQGPINSKSVDKVSVGYDTTAASEEKGGNWNLTVYGTRLLRLANLFGAGGIQLGANPGWGGGYGYGW